MITEGKAPVMRRKCEATQPPIVPLNKSGAEAVAVPVAVVAVVPDLND